MFPTWEIGFWCHVTLVLKVIDFIQKYIITPYVTVTYKVILVFFHQFNVEQLKYSDVKIVTFTVCVQNQGQSHAFVADFCGNKNSDVANQFIDTK